MLPLRPPPGSDDVAADLLHWWQGRLNATGRIPARSDLRAEDLPARLLPHLMLLEFVPGHDDAIIRLVGDHLRQDMSTSPRGRLASEAIPSATYLNDYLIPLYRLAIDRRRPIWTLNELRRDREPDHARVGRLIAPLRGDGDAGDAIDFALCAMTIDNPWPSGRKGVGSWHGVDAYEELERVLL